MRVAVSWDSIELNRVDGCWYTEAGTEIEIEATLQIPGADFSEVFSEICPRTLAVGAGS